MIQRIQTIYLLIVVILTGFCLSSSLFTFELNSDIFALTPYKLSNEAGITLKSTHSLSTLFHLIFTLGIVSIFLYKKRMLQIRLSIFGAILNLGTYALMAYYFFTFSKDMNLSMGSLKIGAIFPVINIIMLILAIRSIGKDEAMVRSLDRIR